MDYSTSQAAMLCDVTDMTIRNWALEYASHLSPTATPPKGQHRLFIEDDLRVFLQVKEMRDGRKPAEAIQAALAAGQRGELRLPETTDLDVLNRNQVIRHQQATIKEIKMELALVQKERDNLAAQLDPTQKAVIELNTKVTVLTEMLTAAIQRAEDAYARGIREGMSLNAPKPAATTPPETPEQGG